MDIPDGIEPFIIVEPEEEGGRIAVQEAATGETIAYIVRTLTVLDLDGRQVASSTATNGGTPSTTCAVFMLWKYLTAKAFGGE